MILIRNEKPDHNWPRSLQLWLQFLTFEISSRQISMHFYEISCAYCDYIKILHWKFIFINVFYMQWSFKWVYGYVLILILNTYHTHMKNVRFSSIHVFFTKKLRYAKYLYKLLYTIYVSFFIENNLFAMNIIANLGKLEWLKHIVVLRDFQQSLTMF